eukprot:2049568-Amphidinium_carterae.1
MPKYAVHRELQESRGNSRKMNKRSMNRSAIHTKCHKATNTLFAKEDSKSSAMLGNGSNEE